MEIQGKIIQVLPLQSGVGKASGKEWKKQEFVLEMMDGQYSRKICFSMWGDLIDRTQLNVGEDVTVQIDVESREYQGRWYTDVKAWRVDRGFVSLQSVGVGVAPQSGYSAPVAPTPAGQPVANDPFGGVQPATFNPATAPAPAAPDDLPF